VVSRWHLELATGGSQWLESKTGRPGCLFVDTRWLGSARACACLRGDRVLSPYRVVASLRGNELPPGFCSRCRTCGGLGHTRRFAGGAFAACDRHVWLGLICAYISLWACRFALLGILALAVLGPFAAIVGFSILGVVISPAVPFGISGLAALCILAICVDATRIGRSRRSRSRALRTEARVLHGGRA
jgi:hypothetical protein